MTIESIQNPTSADRTKLYRKADPKLAENIQKALENDVHIDVVFNPFLDEQTRQAVLNKQEQDPEWD